MRVAQFGVVAAQDFDGALHFVDHAVRRQRREMHAEVALDAVEQIEQHVIQLGQRNLAVQAGDLVEHRLVLLGARP